MGDFSYPAALSLWTLAGLVALVAAGWIFFAGGQRWFGIAALLAAPASLLDGVAGETGYFTAALLLSGFSILPLRPVLAGFTFGLLTLKPQLGVLIPLALLARRDYRAMLSAGVTALALIAVSCALFPAGLWSAWLRQMLIYEAQYLTAGRSLNLNVGVTLADNLNRIGTASAIAWWIQGVASLAGAGVVFLAFRRGPYPLAVAALLAGTCLCAPHAYVYDTIPLTAAMLVLPSSMTVTGLCLVTYLSPFLLLSGANTWFFYAFPETLLFCAIIYLALHGPAHPNIRHEPVPSAKYDPGAQ